MTIKDWRKPDYPITFQMSAYDIQKFLESFDHDDAAEIIIEFLECNQKAREIILAYVKEEWGNS